MYISPYQPGDGVDGCVSAAVWGVHAGVEGDGRGGVGVSSSTSGAGPSSRLARVKVKEKKKLCLLCRHAHNENSDGSETHVLFRPSYIHIVVFLGATRASKFRFMTSQREQTMLQSSWLIL